jgi:hypothetical protein
MCAGAGVGQIAELAVMRERERARESARERERARESAREGEQEQTREEVPCKC